MLLRSNVLLNILRHWPGPNGPAIQKFSQILDFSHCSDRLPRLQKIACITPENLLYYHLWIDEIFSKPQVRLVAPQLWAIHFHSMIPFNISKLLMLPGLIDPCVGPSSPLLKMILVIMIPIFGLTILKRIHADGALLSAGGVVAFYPTNIPLHHRSAWLGDSDPLGYLVKGCRKMNMSIILRTDPHAARQDVYQAHRDWIAVSADGQQRRHWANKDLWVTCALGPYNFEFMTSVNKEIMERYQPEAIFSNRWSGHGICYCEHCVKNFKAFSGLDLPKLNQSGLSTAMASGDMNDPAYRQYRVWRTNRLKELWFLWDGEIRKQKPTATIYP